MGGGFSVIAKEIRKLSDKVATEAHSIDDWINSLSDGAQKGQDAVLKAADDMNKIAESSGQVLARMKDTTVAIRDTENSFSQVQEAIMNIDQGLQKTAAMVEEISTAADTLLMEAEHLMNAAGMNKENLPLSAPTQHELQKPSEKTRRLPRQERLSSSDWEQF
jgi:methyl-accepting chemotaxis protein